MFTRPGKPFQRDDSPYIAAGKIIELLLGDFPASHGADTSLHPHCIAIKCLVNPQHILIISPWFIVKSPFCISSWIGYIMVHPTKRREVGYVAISYKIPLSLPFCEPT
jgi:hypothetical protein